MSLGGDGEVLAGDGHRGSPGPEVGLKLPVFGVTAVVIRPIDETAQLACAPGSRRRLRPGISP